MNTPEIIYEKRRRKYEELHIKQSKLANSISNLRLLAFVAGLIIAGVLYFLNLVILSGASILVTASIFAYIVISHIKILNNKSLTSNMVKVNENAIKRIVGEWKEFSDTGEEFLDREHQFSYDLDIFGRGSLFQMINMTQTYTGRQVLKTTITKPLRSLKEISERQKAVSELSSKLNWRQKFASFGMMISKESVDPVFLYEWIKDRNGLYMEKWVRLVLRMLPSITIGLLVINLISGIIPVYIPIVMLILQGVAIKVNSKKRGKVLEAVSKYKDSIKVYEMLLKRIEGVKFVSPYLNDLKTKLMNKEGVTASIQVRKLSKLVDSISNRNNFFYVLFDILTLWDYQCMIALENWKEQSGAYLKGWLDTIGELEALSSLALLSYDNKDWVIPTITEEPLIFSTSGMGHPLLGKKGVKNDLEFGKNAKALLITGSNMSGKSTLLRTAGINLVLAYAGAAVCAKSFCCSLMEVYTCMRISDDLEKSISSFYAELLRIKTIVHAANEGRKIFFLLDEIFKGTNSIDRHLGAKVLVNRLSNSIALGLVSTHDLELGELENENETIRNFHFREYYKDNEIHFDYKLQKGISKTRNAIYLMKLAGLDFE